MKNIEHIALKDISKYIEEEYGNTALSGNDIFTAATLIRLYGKECRAYNRLLGLNGINKNGQNKIIKNKVVNL